MTNNGTYNVPSHYVKIVLYFLCKRMPDTVYLDRLLYETYEKAITMIISKSRKVVLPIFSCQFVLLLCATVGQINLFPFLVL